MEQCLAQQHGNGLISKNFICHVWDTWRILIRGKMWLSFYSRKIELKVVWRKGLIENWLRTRSQKDGVMSLNISSNKKAITTFEERNQVSLCVCVCGVCARTHICVYVWQTASEQRYFLSNSQKASIYIFNKNET